MSEKRWTIYVCPKCGKRLGGAYFCRCEFPATRAKEVVVVPAEQSPALTQEQRERLERIADRLEAAADRRGVTPATETAHADAELLRDLAAGGEGR